MHCLIRLLLIAALLAGPAGAAGAAAAADVDKILEGIEHRYAAGGIEARFVQTSTLEAMEITDTAEGRLYVRRPGQMRWEYTRPERQVIVSDGVQLWVYRPDDRQVMVGKAPSFFGDGKGASFLADIGKLREQFQVEMAPDEGMVHRLVLTPNDPQPELVRIELEVDAENDTIEAVNTFNAYGDRTRIVFEDVVFRERLDDRLFDFEIPEGVEILQLEQ